MQIDFTRSDAFEYLSKFEPVCVRGRQVTEAEWHSQYPLLASSPYQKDDEYAIGVYETAHRIGVYLRDVRADQLLQVINHGILKKAEGLLVSGTLPDEWEDVSSTITLDDGDYSLGVQALMAALVMVAGAVPEIVSGEKNRTAKVYGVTTSGAVDRSASASEAGDRDVHAGPDREYDRSTVVSAKDVFGVDPGDENARLPEYAERAGVKAGASRAAAAVPENGEDEGTMQKRAAVSAAAAETAQKVRALQSLPGGPGPRAPLRAAKRPTPAAQVEQAPVSTAPSPLAVAKIMRDWPNIYIDDNGTFCSVDLGASPTLSDAVKAGAALKVLSGGKEPIIYTTTDETIVVHCG